jgi:hypothetical protein
MRVGLNLHMVGSQETGNETYVKASSAHSAPTQTGSNLWSTTSARRRPARINIYGLVAFSRGILTYDWGLSCRSDRCEVLTSFT